MASLTSAVLSGTTVAQTSTDAVCDALLMLVPVLPDAMIVPDRRLRGDPNVPMHEI